MEENIIQVEQIPILPQELPKPKKKIILPIIFGILIIGLIALLIFQQKQIKNLANKKPVDIPSTFEPTQIPTALPTKSPTETITPTIENNKFTFNNLSFELPPKYFVSSNLDTKADGGGEIYYIDIIKENENNTFYNTGIDILTLHIDEVNYPLGILNSDTINSMCKNNNPNISSEKIIKIGNNIDAIQLELAGMYGGNVYCFIKAPSYFYKITDKITDFSSQNFKDVKEKFIETLTIN